MDFLEKMNISKDKIDNFFKKNKEIVEKEDNFFIVVFFTIVISFLILMFLNFTIYKLYKPDLIKLHELAVKLIVDKFLYAARPEPVEKMQFIISSLFLPFILMFSYFFALFLFAKKWLETNKYLYYMCLWIAVFLLGKWELGVLGYYISKHIYMYFSIVFPLILYSIFLPPKFFLNRLLDFICLGSILVLFFVNISNYLVNSDDMNINAYFYAMSQVFMGKTILLDFVNQYGLYPHFLEPIFKIIGLNLFNFTIVMSFLLAFSWICIFMFLRGIIKNRVIFFIGFISVFFLCYWHMRLSPVGIDYFCQYFQYFPNRFLFPSLLLLLAYLYTVKPNKVKYYLTFFISACAVLWNSDTGVIVTISWFLFIIYSQILDGKNKILFNILKHFFIWMSSIFFVFFVYSMIILLRSGNVPNWELFFTYQKTFYSMGFYMIEMPFSYAWQIIILVYIFGLGYALRCLQTKQDIFRAKMIFLLSILGIGVFSYFQGRSHDEVLRAVSYPSIMLLGIFADILLEEVKKVGWKCKHNIVFLVMIVYFLGIFPLTFLGEFKKLAKFSEWGIKSIFSEPYIYNQFKRIKFVKNSSFLKDDRINKTLNAGEYVEFIKLHTKPHEKILILTMHLESILYAETSTENILNIPGSTESILKKDWIIIKEFLKKNETVKIFFIRNRELYDNDVLPIADKYYEVEATSRSGEMVLLKKKNLKLE